MSVQLHASSDVLNNEYTLTFPGMKLYLTTPVDTFKERAANLFDFQCVYYVLDLCDNNRTYITIIGTVEHSYSKPEIPVQTLCYKQEFVISKKFPMRYCSTWLRSLLCFIRKFVIEEFVIRVFHCIIIVLITIIT